MTRPALPPFARRVAGTVRTRQMIRPGDRVLAAVSGGADSMALARVLLMLGPALKLSKPGIAHLHHGLRGPEADRDAAFVRAFAGTWDLPFFGDTAPVAALARDQGLCLEEAGRNARYAFFFQVARTHGFDRVALGHTRDDNAEQFLMALVRGSGPRGLSGIPAVRPDGVIRPLIDCGRNQVLSFLSELNQPHVEDCSNTDPLFLRNRIRMDLIPFLETRFNPSIRQSLDRTAGILREEDQYLNGIAARLYADCCRESPADTAVTLSLTALTACPAALLPRVLRRAIADVKTDLRRISHTHIQAIQDLIVRAEPGRHLDLPARIRVYKSRNHLRIQQESCNLRTL